MQLLDEIIKNCSIKTNKSANAHYFILKNRVSFMAKDGKLKTGFIINFSNEYKCDDIFDERSVVKKMVRANVNHICPFVGVGEVKVMVNNFIY
jgi:hypothetical protein